MKNWHDELLDCWGGMWKKVNIVKVEEIKEFLMRPHDEGKFLKILSKLVLREKFETFIIHSFHLQFMFFGQLKS